MNSSRLSRLIALVVFLVGFVFLLLSVATWLRFSVEIPVQDTFAIVPMVDAGVTSGWDSITIRDWIKPISGQAHRIVLTRFLMLVDYTYLSGKNYAIYLSAWFSILLLFLLYVRSAKLQPLQGAPDYYLVSGLALIYLCSPTQYLNLINPVSASWFVAFAMSAAAIYILVAHGNRLTVGWMLLACLCALCAALSNFTGVVGCMIFAVVALSNRSRLSFVATAFSLILIYFYFLGFDSGIQADQSPARVGTVSVSGLASLLSEPAQLPGFTLKVFRALGLQLGAPLSATFPLLASLFVLAAVLLIGYLWLRWGLRAISGQNLGGPFLEFCLYMATLSLVVSCAVHLGRVLLSNPLAPRYQTITMVFWLSMSCLVIALARTGKHKPVHKGVATALALLPVLPLFGSFGWDRAAIIVGEKGAKMQLLGRVGVDPNVASDKFWSRFYGPILQNHKNFLAGYGLSPIASKELGSRDKTVSKVQCENFVIKRVGPVSPGLQEVYLVPNGLSSNPFLSQVYMLGRDGEIGGLLPQVGADNSWRAIYFDRRQWRGYYHGNIATSSPITLYVSPLIGESYQCEVGVEKIALKSA